MATKVLRSTNNASSSNYSHTGGEQLTGVNTTVVTTSNQYSANFAGDNNTYIGFLVKCAFRPASPGSETVTFTLRNTTLNVDVTTVTINKSDIPVDGDCWMFIKWSSSQLLAVATNYAVGIKTNATTSGTTSFYRLTAGADWNRSYVLNDATQAAPGSGDEVFWTGEYTGAGTSNAYTVTMDINSATAVGNVWLCPLATVTWSTGATTLLTTSGNYTIQAAATHNWGTSGTRINASFTSTLDFTGTTKGYIVKAGATDNRYGATLTRVYDQLSSTANSAQANLVTVNDNSADWNQWGKLICVAATTWNSTRQHEELTISSISTTTITATGNLTNTHLGTNTSGQDMRAHVGMLSRNNIMRWNGASATAGYIQINSTATVNWSFAEVTTASSGTLGSNVTGQRGVDFLTTTGSASVTDCSFHDTGAAANTAACIITGATSNNITYSRNIIYNNTGTSAVGISVAVTSGTSLTIDSNLLIGISTGAGAGAMSFSDVGGTYTNNIVNGVGTSTSATATSATGFAINESATFGTISGWNCYCNSGSGISLAAASLTTVGRNSRQVISSCKSWRNNTRGFNLGASANNAPIYTFSSCNSWGNGTAEVDVTGVVFSTGILFLNCTFDSGSGVSSLEWYNAQVTGGITCTLVGCSLGQQQSYPLIFGGATLQFFQIESYGSSIAFTTFVTQQNTIHPDSYFESYNHNATAGDYRLATKNGNGFNEVSDTTNGEHTTCRKLTPNIASNANDDNCEHWLEAMPAISGTAPQPTFRLKSFSSWNGKAYITIFFKGQIVTGPTEITSSINSSTFTNCSITGSNPGENGHFDYRLTYSGTTGGLYLDAEGDAALETIS